MGTERIQVIDRAVELVGLVAEHKEISIAELSRRSGYAMSTAARIIGALASHGIVERTSARRYRLGLRLVALASQVAPTRSLVETAHESMLELTGSTGEDVGLAVLQLQQAVIIDWVYGPNPLKIIEPFSQAITLNCAFRKILLAFQGDSWIKAYIADTVFPRYTSHTLTSRETIWEEVLRIRKTRIAISRAENIVDAGSVAAPIFAATGELAATIFVTCPLTRFNEPDVTKLTRYVGSAANEITSRIQEAGLSRAELAPHNLR